MTGSRNFSRAALLCVGLLALSIGGISCAKKTDKKKEVVKDCELPVDQAGTLSGRWRVQPIPLAFQGGKFGPDEAGDITAAADTWNAFFDASLHIKVLDYGDAGSPRQSGATKPAALCQSGILQGNTFNGQVVIYKQGKWPYSNHDAIALTSFCPLPAKPLPSLFMAIMEVNYENFFVEGKKLPDLRSIFLHELGHLLGLDHSCNTKVKAGFPLCADPKMNQDYFHAVLFPVILFDTSGVGEQRRDLTPNDQGRANCLYQDLVAPAGSSSSTTSH